MAHSLIVKPGAELDITDIVKWYETEKDGLGLEFIDRLEVELQRIAVNPEYFQKRYREIKIAFTKRFPYGIHYKFEKETVFVRAVMRTMRKPRI